MNVLSSLFTGLNGGQISLESKATSFQPGQILKGKVMKLFPNGIASLQVGSQRVVAQLEASLDINYSYWFQVQSGEGKVRLKVISKVTSDGGYSQEGNSITQLMKELSISAKDVKEETMKFFLKERLPISKDLMLTIADWLKETKSLQGGHEAIKLVLQKRLPATKLTFQAILALMDKDSLTYLIQNLSSHIQHEPLSVHGTKLANFLQTQLSTEINMDVLIMEISKGLREEKSPLLNLISTSFPEDPTITDVFKKLVMNIGYSYENDVLNYLEQSNGEWDKDLPLKPLLIEFLKETPSEPVKNIAEKLLHKITGIQLLGQELGPIQQQVIQIPLNLPNKTVDLTIQWNGRKSENNEIDPAYCRVILYLELENLQDTMIDIQVQNRIITITVMNELERIRVLAEPFIPYLKEKLNSIHYTLSNVHFTDFSKAGNKQPSAIYNSSSYSGVDLRI